MCAVIKTTKRPKPQEFKEIWYLVDAQDQILGRLASRIAKILIGKNMPTFDPALVNRTKIVVINAANVKLTGNKLQQKKYYRHSGYMGGLKTTKISDLLAKKPTEVLKKAVSGMLPKNKLRRLRLNNLKIYKDDQHLHQAQNPIKLKI